ncbi:MAG: acyltransferase [Bacteroidales bacterium]|nr:acyltransferase [Bacteroidales bacterium]
MSVVVEQARPTAVGKSAFSMKRFLKNALGTIALVMIVPLLVVFRLASVMMGRDRALEGASQTLACLPGLSGSFLRNAFLRCVLKQCHPSAEIGFGTLFSQSGAIIEENVYVGPRCHLGLVHIERDVLIAAGVHIPSGGSTHTFTDPTIPIKDQGGSRSLITIGAGAWIGSAAIVMADVGQGTIVGAGSVVTNPLPDNVIAVGIPARVIRNRFG